VQWKPAPPAINATRQAVAKTSQMEKLGKQYGVYE